MGWGLKRNATGALERSSVDGHLCICPTAEYTVVFPSTDGYTYERTYPLTLVGSVYVGGGTVNASPFGTPLRDIARITNEPLLPWTYTAVISIEMTIDGLTGERSVRVVSDITVIPFFPPMAKTGQSDYTEVFASGNTFNLSASSATVRPVTLA